MVDGGGSGGVVDSGSCRLDELLRAGAGLDQLVHGLPRGRRVRREDGRGQLLIEEITINY